MKIKSKVWLKSIIFFLLALVVTGCLSVVGIIFWQIRSWEPQIVSVQTLSRNSAKTFPPSTFSGEYIPVSIHEVPEFLKQATVVADDQNFFQHPPFTFKDLSRSLLTTMVFWGHDSRPEGGATLTQLLANQYPIDRSKPQRHVSYLLQRFTIALFLDTKLSKDEQLELYLNENFYGEDIKGIGQAAKVYFHKSVDQLTLAEAIVLAGLPQRPAEYDLRKGAKNTEDQEILWFGRANHVAELMQKQSVIDQATFRKTTQEIRALRDERMPDYDE